MRIDAHQHFWRYDEADYGWIDDRMEVIRRDFLPHDLRPLLESAGVHGSVAVQARQSLEETRSLLVLADENPLVRGVVGWVGLSSRNAAEELGRFAEHPRFVGVRHVVQDEPDDRFLLRKDFQRGVALLEPMELTYDILIYPKQLPAALEFVERFPSHRLVLDHLAKPSIARGELEPWASRVRRLAEHPNLYCKVSGMVTEADWSTWERKDLAPYLDVVFEAFGTSRLMFGSDWPVCTLAASYTEVFDLLADYIEPLTVEEKDAVLGGNAVEFYGLEAFDDAA